MSGAMYDNVGWCWPPSGYTYFHLLSWPKVMWWLLMDVANVFLRMTISITPAFFFLGDIFREGWLCLSSVLPEVHDNSLGLRHQLLPRAAVRVSRSQAISKFQLPSRDPIWAAGILCSTLGEDWGLGTTHHHILKSCPLSYSALSSRAT